MIVKKQQIVAILFYIAYFFILLSDMFVKVKSISNFLSYFDYFSILILIFVFIMQSKKYSYKSLIFTVFLIGISIWSSIISKDKTILKLVLLLINFKDIDFDKFIKKDFIFKSILIIAVIILYYLGMTNNVMVYREGIFRNAFGFSHPNLFAAYLMILCFDLFYINRNKSFKIPIIFSILISFFIYKYVDSRTTLIIILLAIFLIVTRKIIIEKVCNNKIISFIFKNLFLIFLIVSIFSAYKYDASNEMWSAVNKIFSGRLRLNYYFLSNYNINLFGNNVITNEYLILDNSYINVLLRFGISTLFFLDLLFRRAVSKSIEDKNSVLLIIFILLFIYGVSESYLYKVSRNAFLLYFSTVLNTISNRKIVNNKSNKIKDNAERIISGHV